MLRQLKSTVHKTLALLGYRLEDIAAERAREEALRAQAVAEATGPSVWDAQYEKLFSCEALTQRRFYNFGAGNWRHPRWTNIDYGSDWYAYDRSLIDLTWDIAALGPAPIESGVGEAAYCSHTIEHVLETHVDHLFREVARILKPCAVFRVTCPNARIYYEAWRRRDTSFNYHYGAPYEIGDQRSSYTRDGMSIWLV